ncbi:2-acyl-glycerophospho-ethanolamine acyltransferase [Roseitalea porphyridii]|uniref:2-acyl-glycerophospho-ethanolamine acyltransferase n=1 Tax=Roseitalea porphyridii TaxID=1852022 RepID=A0A4P6UZN5_9HYPH|nr:2-acyl-glycerophospho-ethanolamine acyltransferase [Roseitalea porphyridii]
MAWALLAVAIAAVAFIAFREQRRLGTSWRQALALVPLKLLTRLDTRGLQPVRNSDGPVIFAVNEQARLDPAICLAALPDDTLHVLDPASADHFIVGAYRSLGKAVVFDKEKMLANRRLITHLKRGGRLAVYFPDAVEPDRAAFRLYRGVALLARKTGATIVPVTVRNSRFLRSSFTAEDKAPRALWPKLRLHALPAAPMSDIVAMRGREWTTPANALFDRMAELRFTSADLDQTLFEAFVSAARTYGPGRTILEDTVTGALTYKRALIGARVLAKRFAAMSEKGEALGVLLPNANGAAVTFFALQSAGRVAAMLNYTAGARNVVSAIETAKMRTVLSSRAFIEKAELQPLVDAIEDNGTRIVWLEDVRASVTTAEKLSAALQWSRPVRHADPKAPAVILFTSGTEGAPKGVVLSHRNLVVNAAQSEARVSISVTDSLFNVLPLFHSFGLTGGMVLPLLYGVRLFLYPSPLHYKLIPQVAARAQPTIMFGTDTFLAGYARTARDTDFASLRFVVAGAEAVRYETQELYRERFGCAILEGYGMTEASPVVAVNSATHHRLGSVGRALPGIDIRLEPVEGIEGGARMWVKGPNVMIGYLKADRPGEIQPLEDGWYDTGDIVHIDHEGFIEVRGRAKRFAKIGGEMVSLGAVEMLVQSLWPADRHAALSVADRRKGEKIVLATTTKQADRQRIARKTQEEGMTKLMVPSDIVEMEDIPVLGSGKTDYVTLQERVMAMLKRLGRRVTGSSAPRDDAPGGAKDVPKKAKSKGRRSPKASASTR